MEFMEFQRCTSEIVGAASRIDALDKESKDAPDPVKAAYALVRAEYLSKMKVAVDAFKVKLDALVASKSV